MTTPRKIVWRRTPTVAPRKRPGLLSPEEQENTRRAIRSLRARYGPLPNVARAISVSIKSLEHILSKGTITACVALEVARVGGVSMEDVLRGRFPGSRVKR
jgi:hypothetical protein